MFYKSAYDEDAAFTVLTAVLADPSLLATVSARLTPADFPPQAYRPCYEALLSLHRAASPITIHTLRIVLNRTLPGLLVSTAGEVVLNLLNDLETEPAPERLVLESALSSLRALSGRRDLILLAARVVDLASDLTLSPADVLSAMRSALDSVTPPTPPPAAPLLSARALTGRPDTAPLWLLDRLFIAGGVNLLAGEVASGKTFLALDLALSVAVPSSSQNGPTAWDNRPCLSGPVLYCCQDSAPRTIRTRLQALCDGRSLPAPENLFFEFSPLNLAVPADLARLQALVQANRIVLVIFDVLARYLPGLDENSVSSIGPIFTALRMFTSSTGAAVLILHHFNKSVSIQQPTARMHRVRGSSDIIASVDAALSVTLSGTRAIPRRTITPEKNRDLPEDPPFDFSIQPAAAPGSLRLQFSTPAVPGETLVQLSASEWVVTHLQSNPAAAFTRPELQQVLATAGHNLTTSACNRLFKALPESPGVLVEYRGMHKAYRWLDPSA
jgi:hypothetical protein